MGLNKKPIQDFDQTEDKRDISRGVDNKGYILTTVNDVNWSRTEASIG